MRTIAIIKKCTEYEKNLTLSSVEKEDKVLFFSAEKELLESKDRPTALFIANDVLAQRYIDKIQEWGLEVPKDVSVIGFDNSETDDFSPVSGVRIHDNLYLSATSLDCIKATDVITDCGIVSNLCKRG